MYKKILGICTVLAALAALAISPAIAAASPVLTETPATPLAVGAKIKMTGDTTAPLTIFTDTGGDTLLSCEENWIAAQVVKNSGTAFELTIEGAKFQGPLAGTKCFGSGIGNTTVTIPALTNEGGTGHWCMRNTTGDNWETKPEGCNGDKNPGKFTFKLENSDGFFCLYERTSPIIGTFTTGAGGNDSATLAVTGEPILTGPGLGCPTSAKIKAMRFNLYTDTAGVFIG